MTAACLDALVAKVARSEERVEPGKSLLVRIVSMLTRLVLRFFSVDEVREEGVEYEIEEEGENDYIRTKEEQHP